MDIKSIFRSIVGLGSNDMKVNATSNVNGDGNLVVQNSHMQELFLSPTTSQEDYYN